MNRSKYEWLVPLTGVAFVVLLLVSFAVGGEPPTVEDDSAQAIVDHYVDNKDSVEVGAGLGALAVTLLVFFAAHLRKVLRAAEGEGGTLSLVAFIGLVIVGIGGAIDGTIAFALAESAEEIDPTAVQALQALWDNDFLPLAVGVQVFLLGSGLSVVRHGALPQWLGWAAIAFGVIGVIGLGAAQEWGFVSAPAAALWLLIVSVLLTVRARRASAPPAAPSAPAA
jgi:hypothetical protein